MNPLQVHLFGNYAGSGQHSMLRYGRELCQALERSGRGACDVTFHAPSSHGLPAGRWLSYWKRYIEYPLLASRHGGAVNHITDHGNSYLLRFLPAERTVVTCHDLILLRVRAKELPSPLPRWRAAFFERVVKTMEKAAWIITDSEKTREDALKYLHVDPARIKTIHPGVDQKIFFPAPEEKRQFSWRQTLLHVGGGLFYKNMEGVLKTLARLRSQGLDALHLVTVGSPFSQEQKRLVEQLHLESFVHPLGFLSDEALRGIYNASDVLLFPSWWEGFGWPPLEAMACGTPVIVSNRGSLPEVVGDAGVVVDPEDEGRMADAVRRILEDAVWRDDRIEKGFKRAADFSWERTARQVLDIYHRVA